MTLKFSLSNFWSRPVFKRFHTTSTTVILTKVRTQIFRPTGFRLSPE